MFSLCMYLNSVTSILQYSINLQKAWHVELPFQQDIIHTLRNTYSINILREGKRNPLFSNISLGIINRTFLKKKQRNRVCNTILHTYYMLYLSFTRSSKGEISTNNMSLKQQHKSRQNYNGDKRHKDAQSNTDRDMAYSSKQETTVFEIQTRDIITPFFLGGLHV